MIQVQGPVGNPQIFSILRANKVIDYSRNEDLAKRKARKVARRIADEADREYSSQVKYQKLPQ